MHAPQRGVAGQVFLQSCFFCFMPAHTTEECIRRATHVQQHPDSFEGLSCQSINMKMSGRCVQRSTARVLCGSKLYVQSKSCVFCAGAIAAADRVAFLQAFLFSSAAVRTPFVLFSRLVMPALGKPSRQHCIVASKYNWQTCMSFSGYDPCFMRPVTSSTDAGCLELVDHTAV